MNQTYFLFGLPLATLLIVWLCHQPLAVQPKTECERESWPICGYCMFTFDPAKEYCEACWFVARPTGIMIQEIGERIDAINVREILNAEKND